MKKRRRRRINGFLIVINILLLMIIIAGIIFYFISTKKNTVTGVWEYSLDYSDQIRKAADKWMLNDDEVAFSFKPVKIILTLTEDDTYSVSVDEASYRECEDSAYAFFGKRLNYTIENKLTAAGYEGQDVTDVAGNLISQTLEGGDIRSYLTDQGVVILPSIDEIKMLYSENGTYSYDRKALCIEFTESTGKVTETDVLVADNVLVFLGDVAENSTEVQSNSTLIVMDDQNMYEDTADSNGLEGENGYPFIFTKKE